MIFVLSFLALLGSVIIARNSNFWVLFGARCMIGLASSTTLTAALSLLADWFPPEQRGRTTMMVAIGACVGMSAAFGAGGSYLTMAGTATDSWRTAMMGQAAPLALIVGFAMREPIRSATDAHRTPLKQVYVELW